MKKLKKLVLGLALVVCFVGSAVTLSACKKSNKNASMSAYDVLAMGMVSATNYLSQSKGTQSLSALPSDQTQSTIVEYTKMFENMLSNGLSHTESDTTTDDGEYNTLYSKKLSLTLSNETYTMYYNEVVEGTETEIDDNEIEQETTSFLYGVVVKDTLKYNVVGAREIESETKKDIIEYENELKLIFSPFELVASDTKSIESIDVTKLSEYIVIEQEAEENEIEFAYTTKTSTSNAKTVEIEFETENNKSELEIKITENGIKTKYVIEKASVNNYSIKIKSGKEKVIYYLDSTSWAFTEA